MNTSPETTQVSSGADSRSTATQSGAGPVIVQASTPVAPRTTGQRPASAKEARSAPASPVSARTSARFSPDVERSPAAAGKTALEIALAFAGVQAEEPASKGKATSRETATDEVEDEIEEEGEISEETELETEVEDAEEDGEEEDDSEAEEEEEDSESEDEEEESEGKSKSNPLQGIVKALKDAGLGKLAKRVTSIFEENGTYKAQLAQAAQKPIVQLSAPMDAEQPFATAATADEVDAQAQDLQREARKCLRWLNKHPEGGSWKDGDQEAVEMTADDVDAAVEYWENALDGLTASAQSRKDYLAKYADSIKVLGISPADLINPKVATRESKLIRAVPELTRNPDYLAILADAAAGRELREKKAAGQVAIYVDAAKAKSARVAAGKSQSQAAPDRSRAAAAQASAPKAKATAATAPSLENLRALAEKGGPGSRAAQEKLALMAAGLA